MLRETLGSERQRDAEDSEVSVLKRKKSTPQRLSTYDLLLALDHVLRLCHNPLGLTGFQRQDADTSEPTPAESESPLISKNTLVLVSDNGSDANALKWFLQYHLQCRTLMFYDPRHKLIRVMVNSANNCGYQAAQGYARILISWTRGPWDARKWFRVVAEESVEFLKMVGAGHEHSDGVSVIKFMMARCAMEKNVVEHEVSVRTVVDWLREAKFYKQQAASGDPNRWDEFHSAWRSLRSEVSLLTIVLLSYGIKNGLIQMTKEGAPAATESLVRAAEQAGVSENLKSGQKERKVIYSKFKNKLQAILYLLLDNDLLASINTWFAVSNPVSEYLNELRRSVRGREGTYQFWQRLAQGQWRKTLTQISEACLSQECHRSIGISDNTDVAGSVFYFRATVDSAIVQYQDWLFERLLQYACSVMKYLCMYECLGFNY